MNMTLKNGQELPIENELDPAEILVLQRIIRKFREWYSALSVNELTKNLALANEISAFEGIFRAAMM